ncbi:DUF948 domain-containing protein [Oceanobacillus saliphilus]|uniref:DUF948 domain-containing protein n=1 Tax=Oceanobacillus saliphilus TaxID=2925834 RepID=UPI00201D9D0E|nr:DUF948 domain-containing protein [Oceanobacillus saliphilus]
MTLVGIGVLLIGVAFIILAIFIGHALNNLAGVLSGVDKTVQQLPKQLDNIFKETGNMISESNHTLADVNDKLHQLSPLFYIVGDVGNATRKFSSSLVDVTDSIKTKTDGGKEVSDRNKLGGLYGSFALGYYWLKKRREMKEAKGEFTDGNH